MGSSVSSTKRTLNHPKIPSAPPKMPTGVLRAENLWTMSLAGRMNGFSGDCGVFAPFDSKMSRITDLLFIGAEFNRRKEVKDNGITVILNCANDVDEDGCCTKKNCGCTCSGVLTRHIPLIDNITDEQAFQDGAAFIHEHLSNKEKLLVHCAQGISRSVAMVMYYFIHYGSLTPHEALFKIQQKRPFAGPGEEYCHFLMKTFQKEASQSLAAFCGSLPKKN